MAGPYFVGVDQSAEHTGLVVLSESGALVHTSLIEPKGLRGGERLAFIHDTLLRTLTKYPGIDVAVWEFYALKAKHKAFTLGEVGGVVQLALHRVAARVETCTPLGLKKFVALDSTASKAEMVNAVQHRWGVLLPNDNQADAYGLAQLARALDAPASLTLRKQLEVAKTVAAPKKGRSDSFRVNKGML